MDKNVSALLDYVERNYPHFLRGINESRRISDGRFQEITETLLAWMQKSMGSNAIATAVDAYVRFTTEVNLSQQRYEVAGAYEHKTFEQVHATHYGQDATMRDYLVGVLLSNVLWAHHLVLSLHFEDRFIKALPDSARILEIAPGHGAWGLWALHRLPRARLVGYDISPASIKMASSLADSAGMAQRALYHEKNALDLTALDGNGFDACICCFLLEHLECPQRLFEVIHHILESGGKAYITGALTAAQVDHIYEFKQESELVIMAEQASLRVLETLSTNPSRRLPGARFTPRSMALIVQKAVD